MEGYFYHGIEPYYGAYSYGLETMYKILQEGLKTRKEIHNHHDEELNHVCLYKKDQELDYKKYYYKSARAGWIDKCFVLILSPEVEAVKASHENTDLLDEWRSKGNIPPSMIKGIALPMKTIKDYLEKQTSDEEIINDQNQTKKYISLITKFAINNNLIIMDSDMPNFTDELDESLKQNKTK